MNETENINKEQIASQANEDATKEELVMAVEITTSETLHTNEENTNNEVTLTNQEKIYHESNLLASTGKFKKIMKNPLDSDSEDNDLGELSEEETNANSTLKLCRRIMDSDSETEENALNSNRLNEKDVAKFAHKSRLIIDNDSENEGDAHSENSAKSNCDETGSENEESEHSDTEENTQCNFDNYEEKANEEIRKPRSAKEAAEHRIEIYSETQRMLRESEISLPYHVPKARGIKEFLAKRPKFAIDISSKFKKLPPSLAIKMSKSQLEIVSKKLEEREKEVQDFYKSDSENEDKEDEDKECCDNIQSSAAGVTNSMSKETVNITEDMPQENLIHEPLDKETSSEKKAAELCETLKESSEIEKDCNIKLVEGKITEEENVDEKTENANNSTENDSAEFEFDLKDIDEDEEDNKNESEKVILDEKLANLLQTYSISDTKEKGTAKTDNKSNKYSLLKDKLLSLQPRLSGGPDQIIDLDEGSTKPSGVSKLMERFVKHNLKILPQKHDIHMSVLNVEDGEILKEVVNMTIEPDETSVVNETPGIKLKKLREELQNQMAQKRSEQWQQKSVIKAEDPDDEKDMLDDDNDEEDKEVEVSISEEEKLLDEEVLEEDLEDSNNEADEEIAEKDVKQLSEDETNISDESSDSNDEMLNNDNSKRKLKRIIKAFEDSDNEDENVNPVIAYKTKFDGDEEYRIPPNRLRENATPIKFTQGVSNLNCITPLSNLMSFSSQLLDESPATVGAPTPLEVSPLKSLTPPTQRISKILFDDKSQQLSINSEDLADICSGRFPTQINEENSQTSTLNVNFDQSCNDNIENLEELCSGKFPSQTQNLISCTVVNDKQDNYHLSPALPKDFIELNTQSNDKMLNINDNEELLIAELLNEEETDSANNEVTGGGVIYDELSDEEDTEQNRKKKRLKKLNFSDDESESETDNEDGEAIDLYDEDEEAEDNLEVDYDSEENEIIQDGDARKPAINLQDFLENEAELSESEWGSEDEDERNLDNYDIELGDEDQFDKIKLRHDLEKIHMRTILDEDNRDVKLLQELFLEDGELHGKGRQRQFRWKNIDSINSETEVKEGEDEELYYEAESNEDFVKMRHKREQYLQKVKANEENDLIIETSEILKLGQKVTKLNANSTLIQSNTDEQSSTILKEGKSNVYQKGSFLSRKEDVLQRIAEFTKINMTANAAKPTRNFVFQTVEAKKRKTSGETPKAIKKLRLSNKTNKLTDL